MALIFVFGNMEFVVRQVIIRIVTEQSVARVALCVILLLDTWTQQILKNKKLSYLTIKRLLIRIVRIRKRIEKMIA